MKELVKIIKAHFLVMCQYPLFVVKGYTTEPFTDLEHGTSGLLTMNTLWGEYLNSFKPEDNPIFLNKPFHECNNCKNAISRYGNIIALKPDGTKISVWDIDLSEVEEEYHNSIKVCKEFVHNAQITSAFFETRGNLNKLPYQKIERNTKFFLLGKDKNVRIYTKEEREKHSNVLDSGSRVFNHFHLELPLAKLDNTGKSIESLVGTSKDMYAVLKRLMTEISVETYEQVIDAAEYGSLNSKELYISKVKAALKYKIEYDSSENKEAWLWLNHTNRTLTTFRNSSIGTLCVDIENGEQDEISYWKFNKMISPDNYKLAKSPIKPQEREAGKIAFVGGGYISSLNRKFARIDDIPAIHCFFVNRRVEEKQTDNLFDLLEVKETKRKKNNFEGIKEISIDNFIKEYLPNSNKVEAYLVSKLKKHLMVVTTAKDETSKNMFKHNNPFSITYSNNLAGVSEISKKVKEKGGVIDGVLRCSIMWAKGDGDNSDLDLHCKEVFLEGGTQHIYYGNHTSRETDGKLDVDITQPKRQAPNGAVENIVYTDLLKLKPGKYKFFVKQYSRRNSKGFEAEGKVEEAIYRYKYNKPVEQDERVRLFTVTVEINKKLKIEHHLTPTTIEEPKLWGFDTNTFQEVACIMNSPNAWENTNNKRTSVLFCFTGMKTEKPLVAFHTEDLNEDLYPHRKVVEALGYMKKLEPTDNQVCGLGFERNCKKKLIVKVTKQTGKTETVKIIF